MSDLNWHAVKDKVFLELTNSNEKLMRKVFVDSKGARHEMRSFQEIAALTNIQRNQDALERRDKNGIVSSFDLDYKN